MTTAPHMIEEDDDDDDDDYKVWVIIAILSHHTWKRD
jgi:hypothetical protein